MTYNVGSLVKARGREWVVLPDSTDDLLVLRPLGGENFNCFVTRQLPVFPPESYTEDDLIFIVPRVFELTATAWDIQAFADDLWRETSSESCDAYIHQWEENAAATGSNRGAIRPDWCDAMPDGFPYPPFKWDEERRAVLRAELDAYYAKLYGLNRDELRYILDPQDVYGPDFPGETFRVLKDKEIRHFGEYRTRRLVLEAWDRLEGVEIGNPEGNREKSISVALKQETISIPQPKPEIRPVAVQERPSTPAKKEVDPPEGQPTLTDFGLYKCESCGKMEMGYDKANHEREKHGGKSVEWKKIR